MSQTRKLQLLQKNAIRIITSSHYIAHTDPLFYMTKRLQLKDLCKYQLGTFMHKVTHFQLPQNVSWMCLRTDNINKVINPVTKNAYSKNKNKHQEIHNNLFWTDILEHYSCQSSTTCFTNWLHQFKKEIQRATTTKCT